MNLKSISISVLFTSYLSVGVKPCASCHWRLCRVSSLHMARNCLLSQKDVVWLTLQAIKHRLFPLCKHTRVSCLVTTKCFKENFSFKKKWYWELFSWSRDCLTWKSTLCDRVCHVHTGVWTCALYTQKNKQAIRLEPEDSAVCTPHTGCLRTSCN